MAAAFKALGDPTRLRMYAFIRCCDQPIDVDQEGGVGLAEGPTAGQVCCHITGGAKITSTISHHLKELRQAGLIRMERRGQRMICTADVDAAKRLGKFLDGGPDTCC